MNLFLVLLQAVVAIIASPAQGEAVTGSVSITGSATSPQFARYEIAFAYDPNPTDTWFDIQPPSANQVTDGILAVWNTASITDGSYMIRLRVYSSDSSTPTETLVRNVKVRNNAPSETPTPPIPTTPTVAPSPTTVLLGPTATPLPILPSAPAAGPVASVPASLDLSSYTSAFCNGVYLAFGAFLILGLYAAVRDRIRRPIRRWMRRVISDSRKP